MGCPYLFMGAIPVYRVDEDLMTPLQAVASTYRTYCTYRIAAAPRAVRKVLTLMGARKRSTVQRTCARYVHADGFSPHAGVRCEANER